MAQRFNEGNIVRLKVEKTFSNPTQTLQAGSRGKVILKFSDRERYRIKFDKRDKFSIISDSDLE